MNIELKGFGRKLSYSHPGIWLEGLKKTTRYLIQDNHCPGRDENPVPPEYESRTLPLYRPARYFDVELELKDTGKSAWVGDRPVAKPMFIKQDRNEYEHISMPHDGNRARDSSVRGFDYEETYRKCKTYTTGLCDIAIRTVAHLVHWSTYKLRSILSYNSV
jgi:hypothetical protein